MVIYLRALLAVGVVVSLVVWPIFAKEKGCHSAIIPVPRDASWLRRHEKFVDMAKRGNIDLLFLGDSITDSWGGEGHNPKASGAKIFAREFEPLHAKNFGLSGDRTQHVLWRIINGELNGIEPKVAMLMIGTNNSNGADNTSEEIADGVVAIVSEIRRRSPKTKVLLLGIFPRHNKATEDENRSQKEKIDRVNAIIGNLNNDHNVKFLDIGDKFKRIDGTIPTDIMPDQLHLSEKGYQIWADAVKQPILDLLTEQTVPMRKSNIDP